MSDGFDFWFLLTVAIGILVLFVLFIIIILLVYQRKTVEHQQKVTAVEQNMRQEVLKTQIEVQDQTLTYVSREIHDNITQVLSFIKLSLGTRSNDAAQIQKTIDESRSHLAQAINDLRDLSKSMSFDTIKAAGLQRAVEIEIDRINKSNLIKADLTVTGDVLPLGEQTELFLFRIFQEAVNNALKYANATQLNISLLFGPESFNLIIVDNGVGFEADTPADFRGSGLRNLQNRAVLIGAEATVKSSPGNGCIVTIALNPLTAASTGQVTNN